MGREEPLQDQTEFSVGTINPENSDLNPLPWPSTSGENDAVRRIKALDHRTARLTEDPWHLAVNPDLSIVVDHDLKSHRRTGGAEVPDPLGDSHINAIPVETDLRCRAPLVKGRRLDRFPLRIVEVNGTGMGAVVVRPNRSAARL